MVELGLPALISLTFFLLLVGIMLLSSIKKPYIITSAVRFLRSHAKMNMALICAACVSTIVITGSLIAGDSLRESITDAVYDNLGGVDEIITSDNLFNGSIVVRLAENESLMGVVDRISPLIYMKGVAESPSTGARTRTANIIGFDQSFLGFGTLISVDGKELNDVPGENEVYLNEALADEIGISKGDRVNISFSRLDRIFEAVFLGNQSNTNFKIQLEVKDIVKAEGLGRFQLNSNRNAPQNVYVAIESLRKIFKTPGAVNMILISNTGDEREGVKHSEKVSQILRNAINDTIGYEDVGLKLLQNPEANYVKLEAANVFFSYDYHELLSNDQAVDALDASSPILTYFWNSLSHENRSIPYSTVTAFNPTLDERFGSFTLNGTAQTVEGILAEDEIIINNWTAERLGTIAGDTVVMNYSIMDEFYDIRYLTKNFTVRYIVDIEGKANDSMLMPFFPGIEGKVSAFDWDPPFPIDLSKITDDDEKYWQVYGGTPKAFISLETGMKLWETDIGNITQIRLLPNESSNLSALTERIEHALNRNIGMKEASLTLKNVKLDALASAEGIELFTAMFLTFSASCIIASMVLIMLLITLRVDSRMAEIGILRALGFRKGAVNHIFLVEGAILTIIGGLIGTLLALLFGLFLINGMNSFWSSIVEGSSVGFHFTIDSLVMGFSLGIIISILTMMIALRYESRRTVIGAIKRLRHRKEKKKAIYLPSFLLLVGIIIPISLLLGIELRSELGLLVIGISPLLMIMSAGEFISMRQEKRIDNWAGLAIIIYTLFLMLYFLDTPHIIPLFFLSGFMLLTGFLLIFYHSLMKTSNSPVKEPKKMSQPGSKRWLLHFAVGNAARRPRRTMFTVILFSFTLFVLVSLTINLQGTIYDAEKAVKEGGGGYHIIGESTNPIFANLGDEGSRAASNINSQVFDELDIEQFKTKGDVGGTCSNLNRAASPRIIGANDSFLNDNTFVFVSHADLKGDGDNPWLLLEKVEENGDIPAIGDYNTIVWILGLDLGSTITVLDESGTAVNLRIAGIVGNSIFQGSLIIWDENFDALYPTNNGYRLFLFKSQAEELKPQIHELERSLAGYGFDAYSVESVVIENILVENTYISIFQVILVFGLMIGTLGFGIVTSRNVLERGRETGVLRAIGFSKSTILKALFLENSYVILCAIAIGTSSGIIASSIYLVKLHLAVGSWPWLHILAMVAASYGVAMLSAFLPTIRSTKASISDAIRTYE